MAPASQALIQVYTTFAGEIARHRAVFLRALANQPSTTGTDLALQQFAGWHCLIALHDAWSRFCKHAIIVSALGGVVSNSGNTVAPSPVLAGGASPLDYLQSNWPKGLGRCYPEGPKWYEAPVADVAAQILQIGNYAAFSGAILAKADAPTELKACRNYLAHRDPGTENHNDIQNLRARIKVAGTTPHTERLAEYKVSGSTTLFEEWCIELDTIAGAAIA